MRDPGWRGVVEWAVVVAVVVAVFAFIPFSP